jgi:hypothetical protein
MTRVAWHGLSAYCILAVAALSVAAAEPSGFRFSKSIERGTTTNEALIAVSLDSDVYASTQTGFPDLRILDAQDKETPFVLEKATQPRVRTLREQCASRVVSLKEHADGIELLVKLDKDAPAARGISLITPLTNYERHVRVAGSDDGNTWTPLVENAPIFDYSRYFDIDNHEIRLPTNTFRQLKVIVSGITDARESPFVELTRKYRGGNESERIETTQLQRRPFRIERIELWHEREEPFAEEEKTKEYPARVSHVDADAKEKSTIVYVETRHEPLTKLTLETTSRNFSRSVRVQVPTELHGQAAWTDIAEGRMSSIRFGDYQRDSLGISFPEQRAGQYRLVIRDNDNPPLKITGIQAQGNVYRAVFLAAASAGYRLVYGSEAARQPDYDAASVIEPLRHEGHRPAEVRLGPETRLAAAAPPSHTLQNLLNNPVLLGALIVALVALLGWALFRAAGRINQLPKDGE